MFGKDKRIKNRKMWTQIPWSKIKIIFYKFYDTEIKTNYLDSKVKNK